MCISASKEGRLTWRSSLASRLLLRPEHKVQCRAGFIRTGRALLRAARVARIVLLCLPILSFPGLTQAGERLKVVATTSDLKSLVQAVGGDQVEATGIASPNQDPESFQPRPGDLAKLKNAKLVVRVGLDYDLWLDRLLKESGNPALQRGGSGYVDASNGIALLEVRSTAISPTPGHAHGAGNPHYWLDPGNAEIITGSILEGLERIDPTHAKIYGSNRAAFLSRLKEKIANWEARLIPFRGVPIVAYHNSWPYLARRFRLKIIDFIEPKPGVPPSPVHLAELMGKMKAQRTAVIIKEPFEPTEIPLMLERKTGARVAVLAPSVGAVPEAGDYFTLFEYNVNALVRAFGKSG